MVRCDWANVSLQTADHRTNLLSSVGLGRDDINEARAISRIAICLTIAAASAEEQISAIAPCISIDPLIN